MNSHQKLLDIICLGEPMLEFNQQQNGMFKQGHGGDTSNCAISAARQGAKAGYITAIGDDDFGRSFLVLWQADNIDTSQVRVNSTASTGIYFVTHDQDGHHYTYYRKDSAAAQMQPAQLSNDFIASARYLHVSAISQAISQSAAETVAEAISIANANDTVVAYDTNLRLNLWNEGHAREVVHEAMRHCQIALPSYEDATVLTQKKHPQDIVDFYLALGCETVVLKLGAEGSIVATKDKRTAISGKKVSSIDTNAAGDTFAGAFLAQLAKGCDVFAATEYANVAAALSTQSKGAASSIPNRDQVLQYLASH